MNRFISLIAVLCVALLTATTYAAVAPNVTITSRTTTSVTFSIDDTTGMAKQDSVIFIFSLTAADSLDGTGYEVRTANADTLGPITISGLPERTWGTIIVRSDSIGGVKAYSARDSVRTLAPQIIDARRPDFSAPVGTDLTDASSYSSVSGTTWTIKTTGLDSTGVYYSAPYESFLLSIVGQTDSTNVKIVQMVGYTDEANRVGTVVVSDSTKANWYATNTFMFAAADTIDVTTAGTYYKLDSFDYGSFVDKNVLHEMFYLRILGQATNDKSTGTVLTIRAIRSN